MERVSPRDCQLAEELLRVWNAAQESGRLVIAPEFETFVSSVKAMLESLGMEWDVAHGYVFPWTDRTHGPFPMTGNRTNNCSKMSLSKDHAWKFVGVLRMTPMIIRVIYGCEKCSSWTYHEMDFVGYRLSSVSDRKDEAEET